MSPLWGHAVGVFILVMMFAFIAIWVWVWLPFHKRKYSLLAHLPMEDSMAPADHSIPHTDEEARR